MVNCVFDLQNQYLGFFATHLMRYYPCSYKKNCNVVME